MADKVIDRNPLAVKGWQCSLQTDFEQDYVSMKLVDVAKKVGEGDEDYIIEKKVIYEKEPIQEVVNADADSVGVYNIIKMVTKTGDLSLLPRDTGNPLVDTTQAPENLMELKEMGVKAEKAFKKLPQDLVKGLDMKSFVETMTQDQFDAFVKAVADRSSGKVEKKDE